MSRVELLVDRRGPLTRAAVVEDGRLTDLQIDHAARPSFLGAVFLGRVERISTGLDAAFVDLGTGRSGLLAAADARGPKGRVERIGTLLRAGQPVLVQVKADPVGEKGAVLTMDVALPGRFLVHVPLGRGIAVSKRLAAGTARTELLRRIEQAVVGDGWIARAGAAAADPALLAAEADDLALRWRAIEAQAASAPPPARLRDAPEAAVRLLVERGAEAPDAIVVEGAEPAAALSAWCADAAPDLAERVRTAPSGLFDRHDLEGDIAALVRPRVALTGGASLVIERTEALTVIDVNAGERGNALEVNLEASAEIARQLRLRNVGGIVVVDFVNMKNRGDAERLLGALARRVEDDPVQTHVYGLSKLGLVEMTRARRGAALADLLASGPDNGESR